jgi:hypothetical protein
LLLQLGLQKRELRLLNPMLGGDSRLEFTFALPIVRKNRLIGYTRLRQRLSADQGLGAPRTGRFANLTGV